ncbi:MAG: alpha/beta fold hydrolase [Rehaibacterium terrae]|uniref:alpha/beta fold hydrolase n=1 Tax=Rehaibacterium terrae TaxID=1341696 RepID=UPI0039198A97
MIDILRRNHVVDKPGTTDVPLLYAHGFGCNQDMWADIVPAFEGRHRQVLFDYVGSGRSDPAAFSVQRYRTLEGYAQDLLEVCEATGLTQDVVVVAHSVSCSIAMLAAVERPQWFRHLVLVGPNPCFVNDPPYIGGFERKDLLELLELLDRNYMGWADFLAPVVAGASEQTRSRLRESFCSTDPVMARTFAEATFFADNRADLPRVPTPCLILQHARDALAPLSVGEYMHAHLPHSTLQVLDVTGHCAHMSHPELVIEAIRHVLPT